MLPHAADRPSVIAPAGKPRIHAYPCMHPSTQVLDRYSIAMLLIVCGSTGCSHSLSHDDLQSKFRASISLASESEQFLEHLDESRFSPNFIKGHLSYLRRQSDDIREGLDKATPDAPDTASLNLLKATTKEIDKTLSTLASNVPPNPALSLAIGRLGSLRRQLARDMPQ
jgi:hypothetical protein